MIVADANLLAYLLLDTELTAQAREVWYADGDWAVPEVCLFEFTNVLVKFVRGGQIPLRQALRVERLAAGRVGRNIVEVRQSDALRLAAGLVIAGFDAHYLAAAIILRVPCVTEDKALRRAAPRHTLSMNQFLSWRGKHDRPG